MTKDEALKLALDLATMHHTDDGYKELRSAVRVAIKEALAQPEQEPLFKKIIDQHPGLAEELKAIDVPEPVGVVIKSRVQGGYIESPNNSTKWTNERNWLIEVVSEANIEVGTPIYIELPQRTWIGLTKLDKRELWGMSGLDVILSTEAKLKEKNT